MNDHDETKCYSIRVRKLLNKARKMIFETLRQIDCSNVNQKKSFAVIDAYINTETRNGSDWKEILKQEQITANAILVKDQRLWNCYPSYACLTIRVWRFLNVCFWFLDSWYWSKNAVLNYALITNKMSVFGASILVIV